MSTTMEGLKKFMARDDFEDWEKRVAMWQFNQGFGGTLLGSWETALWELIKLSDENNLQKLAVEWPNEIKGYLAWTRGGLAGRMRAVGLQI